MAEAAMFAVPPTNHPITPLPKGGGPFWFFGEPQPKSWIIRKPAQGDVVLSLSATFKVKACRSFTHGRLSHISEPFPYCRIYDAGATRQPPAVTRS